VDEEEEQAGGKGVLELKLQSISVKSRDERPMPEFDPSRGYDFLKSCFKVTLP